MKITEIRKPLEAKCPICNRIFQEWYCPSCGLPISTFHRKRPENSSLTEFQLCNKCDTPNPYGAKYCKNCRENITLQAKDKNGHGWVDLGLSVLWSTESINGYYYWMDTINLLEYNLLDMHNYRKEDDLRERTIAGKDTATYKWGNKWRIPTYDDFKELIEKCNWEITLNQEFKVTGPNGNHIILPKLGFVKGKYIYSGSFMQYIWKPEILEFNFGYWSSTKGLEENCAFIFSPRISGISSKTPESLKEKILERQRLHFSSSTPIDEKLKLFMKVERYKSAYSIRPVADKKWQGKL